MKLTDLPRPIAPSTYEQTRQAVRDAYIPLSGVRGVVEFGTIPYPGISDMDFYILTDPGGTETLPRMRDFSHEQQYAMSHMQFRLSTSIFPYLRFLDPWLIHVLPLFTRGIRCTIADIEELTEEERQTLSLDFIFVFWISSSLALLAQIRATGHIDCREFMESAKGSEYCLRELKRAGIIDDSEDPNMPLRNLRKEWFSIPENDRAQRVQEAVGGFEHALKLMIRIMTDALQKRATPLHIGDTLRPKTATQRRLLALHPRSLILETSRETFIYTEHCQQPDIRVLEWTSPCTGRAYTHNTYILPLTLSATQNTFFEGRGPISRQYAQCACTDLDAVPLVRHPALTKRFSLIDQNFTDTMHVAGGKSPTITYDAMRDPSAHSRGTLRARMGGIHDRFFQRLHATPLRSVFPMRTIRIPL